MLLRILRQVLRMLLHIQQREQPIQWQQGKGRQHKHQEQGRLVGEGMQGMLEEHRVAEEGIPVGEDILEEHIDLQGDTGGFVGIVAGMVAEVLHAP